jgi:nitrous oxide reductase
MLNHDPRQDAGRRLSRRSMLRGAVAAGAAGLAVTAIGAGPSAAQAATTQPSGSDQHGNSEPATAAGPLVVHVRDAKTGDIEVFSGTRQTRLRDKDLAARIAAAIR